MRFDCPNCAALLQVDWAVHLDEQLMCPLCNQGFLWSVDLVVPYCYACGSRAVAKWVKTPLGWIYGCAKHVQNLTEFWLLPMIKFTVAGHAREYDGSPINGSDGSLHLKKAVGL